MKPVGTSGKVLKRLLRVARRREAVDMHAFYEDYLALLGDLHEACERAIDGLSQETLDWTPGPEMNSIAVLVVHLTGAERYWIGDVASGDPSGRVREEEFRAHGLSATVLRERLSEALDYARRSLEPYTLDDLLRSCSSPRDGHTWTVGWALAHALAHTALHLGHIQITRQWWDGTQFQDTGRGHGRDANPFGTVPPTPR